MTGFDVTVVGGGPAGLAAALLLGRARTRVVVVDGGEPRNAPSHAAHSMLTRDGVHPAELRRIAVDQLAPYDVTVVAPRAVTTIGGRDGEFVATLDDGRVLVSRKVILATGVRDVLPDIPGVRELFGTRVFHCPYCDAWEVRDQPLALMLSGMDDVAGRVRLFLSWTRDLAVIPAPGETLDGDAVRELAEAGIPVHAAAPRRVEPNGEGVRLVLDDGADLMVRALFLHPRQEPRTELARQLGCALVEDGPFPGQVVVDAMQETSVAGVFAAGDITTRMQQVWIAATEGGKAGVAAHRSLVLARSLAGAR